MNRLFNFNALVLFVVLAGLMGMCSVSNAAPVAEKAFLEQRIRANRAEIQVMTIQIRIDEARLKAIEDAEAAQKKALEEHKAKEAEGEEP